MKKSFGIYIIFILITVWFVAQVLYPSSRILTHGFGTYYSAARLLRTGQFSDSIYDPTYFRAITLEDSQQQVDDIYNANPPTTSLMFWPLSFFSIEVARIIWIAASALMLWGGLALLVWAFSDQPTRATYFALFSLGMLFQPAIENIRLGQAYLLIFLLLAVATIAFEKREARWGGASLALALILKTAGWAILPLLGWQRRWQYLAWTLGISGIILLLTLPLFPLSLWQTYLRLLTEINQSPQVCVTAYQTTRSLLCHTLIFHETWNPSPLIHLPWLARWLYIALACITFILSFDLSRHNQTAAFISIIAWSVIFGPLGEQYHHSVMLIPIVWLILGWQAGQFSNRIGKWGIVIATLLYIYPFHIGHVQFQDGWWALLAYPRVYSAWLILLAIYSQSLQRLYARFLHR